VAILPNARGAGIGGPVAELGLDASVKASEKHQFGGMATSLQRPGRWPGTAERGFDGVNDGRGCLKQNPWIFSDALAPVAQSCGASTTPDKKLVFWTFEN